MDDSSQAQLPTEANTMGVNSAENVTPLPSADASYKVLYTEEGVFLDITRKQGEGQPLQVDAVLFDLNRRGIDGLNINLLRLILRRNDTHIRVSAQQSEKNTASDVFVLISKDEMTASLMLLPPVLSGAEKTSDEILDTVKSKYEITFGLNEQLVKDTVDNKRYYHFVDIAHGQPAQKGKDGELTIMFNSKRSYAPKILPDGSADYKNMNLFEHVSQGDVVATIIPPEDGVDGTTVKGKNIPSHRGKEKKLPKGKNVVVSEDGKSLLAEKSGRVDFVNSRIDVSDLNHIAGNVDMSVGNIVFDGDVVVDGDVITGLTIEASGSIEIRGYVEGAVLIAGKDIVLRNGMQGISQGKLEAGGNIVARFIERATINAKGSVFADYLVYCVITAGDSVILKGKFGKLLGGLIRAGREVTARTIGSPGNDQTQIELGILPDERARYTKLDTERGQIKAQLNRIQNIIRMPAPSDISPERLAMRKKLEATGQQLQEQYNTLTQEIEKLKEILSANSDARVNATKAVYSNVRIQIDSGFFITKTMIEFATFRCLEGAVNFTACEIKA